MKLFKAAKIILFIFLFILFLPVGLYLLLAPTKKNEVKFGLNFSNKYATELDQDWESTYNAILKEIPTKKFRLVVYWNDVEAVKGKYDYSDIKYQLDALEKYPESEVLMVIGRKVIRYPECHEPGWWQELRSEEQKKKELLIYIEKTVNELKGYKSIKNWQVENEALFPFGDCTELSDLRGLLQEEVGLVRKLDPSRKIVIQDSGEAGVWQTSSKLGDFVGISMYRKVWFNFFDMLNSYSFQLKYPLGPAYYYIKAKILGIQVERIRATEVQAEAWGPVRNYLLTQEEVNLSMSHADFDGVLDFVKSTGFDEFDLWGVEWWYHMKIKHNDSYYWDIAKKTFK